ncbi:MAG: allophanate hydrolase [Dehalococcoidia bacterium]
MRIGELTPAYAAGRDPHDVVDEVLARIDAGSGDGVWISRFDAAALHARADELVAAPQRGPLWGVPFAVKDNIDVAGLPTTAACPAFAYEPAADASSVERLLAAGAIAVGKVNLDQFATGLNGTRSPFGAPESVFGGDLISGGSSSGSAVAVAAGQVAFALGTDTAGSGRVPAAMNGIVGLKPTRGLVGATGMLPACRSLDCVTAFTRDVDDAEAVLAVLAGPDPDDAWSRTGPPCPPGLRLALAEDLDLDPAFETVFAEVAEAAAGRAEAVHRTTVAPMREAGDLLYSGPWVAERLAGLAGFLAEHADDVLPVVRGIVEQGARFDAVDCFRARHRLQELRAWTRRLWERADVLLLPTTPTTFTRAQMREDPVGRNLVLGRYTQFANLLDLAAVAVPGGMTPDGRPVGVTLIGPAFSEARLLDAARRLLS